MPEWPIKEKNPLSFSDRLVIAEVKGRAGMSKGVDLYVENPKTCWMDMGGRIRPAGPGVSGCHKTMRGCNTRSYDDVHSGLAGVGYGIESATTRRDEDPACKLPVTTLKE